MVLEGDGQAGSALGPYFLVWPAASQGVSHSGDPFPGCSCWVSSINAGGMTAAVATSALATPHPCAVSKGKQLPFGMFSFGNIYSITFYLFSLSLFFSFLFFSFFKFM